MNLFKEPIFHSDSEDVVDENDFETDTNSSDSSDSDCSDNSDESADETRSRTTMLFVKNNDYVYNSKTSTYYINYPTLVKVAILVNDKDAMTYIEDVWTIICYINDYNRKAFNNVISREVPSIEQRMAVSEQFRKLYEKK